MKTFLHSGLLLITYVLCACQSSAIEAIAPVASASKNLVLLDRQGGSHSVGEALAKGDLVVLVFWQTWCSSCLEETPQLIQASKDFQEAIEFFGVVSGPDRSVDEEQLDAIIESLGIPYPQVRDRDLALATEFGVEATPTIIVIGADRRIVYSGHRPPQSWQSLLSQP